MADVGDGDGDGAGHGQPLERYGSAPGHGGPLRVLALGALGVVFGDIGTSPLYAFKTCLIAVGPLGSQAHAVLGILSLIFWAITLVVTVKYVGLVLRADNRGEGGVLALTALVSPTWPSSAPDNPTPFFAKSTTLPRTGVRCPL